MIIINYFRFPNTVYNHRRPCNMPIFTHLQFYVIIFGAGQMSCHSMMGIRVTCRPATRPKDRANRGPEGRLTPVYGVVPLMMFTEFSVENFQNADIPCQTNLQLSLNFYFY